VPVEIGEVVAGRVVKILRYGAIVELEGGETGLVHISEIAPEFVVAVEDHLREGDDVRVKVLGMREPGRYDLSIKQAEHADTPQEEPRRFRRRPTSASFERRLGEFMKASNRRQSDLNRGKSGRKRGRR